MLPDIEQSKWEEILKDVKEVLFDIEDARPTDITIETIRKVSPGMSPVAIGRALAKIMNAHPGKYIWVTVYVNRRRSKALRLKES